MLPGLRCEAVNIVRVKVDVTTGRLFRQILQTGGRVHRQPPQLDCIIQDPQ